MINMIFPAAFDNFEQPPRFASGSKPENFAVLLSVTVAPPSFPTSENKKEFVPSKMSSETLSDELDENVSDDDCKMNAAINPTIVFLPPNTVQTEPPTKFASVELFNSNAAVCDNQTAVISPHLQDAATNRTIPNVQEISSAVETVSPNQSEDSTQVKEITAAPPVAEPFNPVMRTRNGFDGKILEAKPQKIKLSAPTFETKTPETKVSPRTELFDIEKSTNESPKTAAIAETLPVKSPETEISKAEKPAEKTESDFSFNFDKFLTSVTRQSKSVENTANEPVESQKIFEQFEPQMLHIISLINNEKNKKTMKMRLHPAELGAIEIKLEKNAAGKIIAHFQTETEAARQNLAQNIEQLRDSLQNSGCQVERLDVTCQQFSPNGGEQNANHSRHTEPIERQINSETASNRKSESQDDLKHNQTDRLLSIRA